MFVSLALLNAALSSKDDLAAREAAAPVLAAYAQVEARQARMPPPRSDRERLVRLQALDQAGRDALVTKVDLSRLDQTVRDRAKNLIGEAILSHDLADQATLKAMIPASGWFPISVYGKDGALAAWLVVQHAVNDPPLMRRTVAALDRMRHSGEAQPTAYAIMYDRVALTFDLRPQRYGTQLECKDGRLAPQAPVEDPRRLDARRKAIGFKDSEAAYVASMQGGSCGRGT